ncbi:MAG: universal stress protein [Polaromonas sp.]|jgi:nucleotide-binding universal stress UspA family protein|nr:universal stress protein [Polaromonas sp.]MBP6088592.1 universal stress protein [Polaromonas sp.]MBP6156217.1 universal stress protein [Polaromonas sp.]MBP7115917.1 universal stress protein [Polaromonas sp.]MBP8874322.1 universal stress protein [Polaromonas sp.]
MKILLAVDGSTYTKKMLAYLATHESLLNKDNNFTVLTVHLPIPSRARAAVGKDIVEDYYKDDAEKVLAPIDKFLARHGIQAKSVWKAGNVGETIATYAEAGKFDMLVMGSHGHGSFLNMVLGSVATKVLANCKTPVLLVR